MSASHGCDVCSKPAHTLCAGCPAVYYCNRECQRIGWKSGHKRMCASMSVCLHVCLSLCLCLCNLSLSLSLSLSLESVSQLRQWDRTQVLFAHCCLITAFSAHARHILRILTSSVYSNILHPFNIHAGHKDDAGGAGGNAPTAAKATETGASSQRKWTTNPLERRSQGKGVPKDCPLLYPGPPA